MRATKSVLHVLQGYPLTTLVTLELEPEAQACFEALRQEHYPAEFNRIPAHLSLFHKLPGTDEIADTLRRVASSATAFSLTVAGVRSLGRGVAYTLVSPKLVRVHRELARSFEPYLTPQDRQPFQPHIVVQNKATHSQARELLASLQMNFVPDAVQATGLLWWEYLGGPWRLLETIPFQTVPSA